MAGTEFSKKGTLTLKGTLSSQIEKAKQRLMMAENNDCIGGHREIRAARDHLNRLLLKQKEQGHD